MLREIEKSGLVAKLAQLRREHRALDEEIVAAAARPGADQLALRRQKKRKLALRDAIAEIEDKLYPDIIA